MNKYLLILCLSLSLGASGQSADETAIRDLLSRQSAAWNKGDIEGFMKGYWNHDSLRFIGSSGIVYGFDKTLKNYRKSYPDTKAMGTLDFTLLHLDRLSDTYYSVTGKWHLKRVDGDLGGYFTLLLRKLQGEWVIIADHSS